MNTDALGEFYTMVIDAALFLLAIAAFIVLFNSVESSVAQTKQGYSNDGVYSEASLEVSDESTISREELMSLLMRCPNRNMIIRDSVARYVLTITAGDGIDTVVTIKKYDLVDSQESSTTINFGKERWNTDKINLDMYLQAKSFKMKEMTYPNGEIKSVLYFGE